MNEEIDEEPPELTAKEVQDRLAFRFGPEPTEWRQGDDCRARFQLLRGWKLEILDGQLGGSEEQRLVLLGLVVESLGLDKVVQLGDPASWRRAIEKLSCPAVSLDELVGRVTDQNLHEEQTTGADVGAEGLEPE